MPDHWGHNVSEGWPFTASPQAVAYYAEDVVALLAGLRSPDHADTGNVFLCGHSMGGPITITADLAAATAGVKVRGVSHWSTAPASQDPAGLNVPLLLQRPPERRCRPWRLRFGERVPRASP